MTETYSAENIFRYRTAIAMVDDMEKSGCFTETDKKKIYEIIAKNYGLDSCSIFTA